MKNAKPTNAVGFSPAATLATSTIEWAVELAEWGLFAHLLYELHADGGPAPGWELVLWLGSLILGLYLDYSTKRKLQGYTLLKYIWTVEGLVYFNVTATQASADATTAFLVAWKLIFFVLGEPSRKAVSKLIGKVISLF